MEKRRAKKEPRVSIRPIARIPKEPMENFELEASFPAYLQGVAPKDVVLTPEDLDYDEKWTQGAKHKFAAYVDGKFAGFVAGGTSRRKYNPYHPESPEGRQGLKTSRQWGLFDLNAIYVHPDFRHHGIMTALLERLATEARAQGYDKLLVRHALSGPQGYAEKIARNLISSAKENRWHWTVSHYDPERRKYIYTPKGSLERLPRSDKLQRRWKTVMVEGGPIRGVEQISGGEYDIRGKPFRDEGGRPNYIRHFILHLA